MSIERVSLCLSVGLESLSEGQQVSEEDQEGTNLHFSMFAARILALTTSRLPSMPSSPPPLSSLLLLH